MVLWFELKVVEIGGSYAVDRRQYPAFRRTQNEAHRMKNVNKIIFCASTKIHSP